MTLENPATHSPLADPRPSRKPSFVRNWTRAARRFLPLLLLCCAAPALRAQDKGATLEEIRQVLRGPVQILLDSGARQTGSVVGWDGETLELSVSLGGGSAEMSFPADTIRGIAFPGSQYTRTLYDWMEDPDRADDALELFRAFYQQKGQFFDLLDRSELNLFVRYAQFALEQNEPLRAVAMIEVLRPQIEDAARLKELDEAILTGFFLGGMSEEAEDKARELIRSYDPAGDSALPWRVLAELHFQNERYEEAFWTALQPVAFSSQLPAAQLDACYALAVVAAEEMRLDEASTRLALEMRERGYAWPETLPAVAGRAPEVFTAPPAAEGGEEEEEDEDVDGEALEPLQTPSPVDPVESLPTRLLL